MTANEHWRYRLRCPRCGREGTQEETQLDGWPFMRAVQRGRQFNWVEVSEGFRKVEETREGYAKVVCADCNVEPEKGEIRGW